MLFRSLVPHVTVGFSGWPVAAFAGLVWLKAPGGEAAACVVKLLNAAALPSAYVVPLPFVARTCQ